MTRAERVSRPTDVEAAVARWKLIDRDGEVIAVLGEQPRKDAARRAEWLRKAGMAE